MISHPYDETFFTALHSLDLGDVHSPDGRAHPVTAMTPVVLVDNSVDVPVAATTIPAGTSTGPTVTAASFNPLSGMLPSMPQHFGARLAVAVVAVGVLLIVVIRLTK